MGYEAKSLIGDGDFMNRIQQLESLQRNYSNEDFLGHVLVDDKLLPFVYEERSFGRDTIYLVDRQFKEQFELYVYVILSKKIRCKISPRRQHVERKYGTVSMCNYYSLFIEVTDPQLDESLFLLSIEEMKAFLDIVDSDGMVRVIMKSLKRLVSGILLLILSCVFFVGSAVAADLDQDGINNLIRKSGEQLKTMPVTTNQYDKIARDRASKIMERLNSAEFQTILGTETEHLKSTIFKDHVGSFATPTTVISTVGLPGRLSPNERVYVFISSSMPIQTLRNYAAAIHTIGDPNVVMVMRGFVGGIKDWRKTTEFSSQVLARDPFCNIRKAQCEMFSANLEVDPLLFRRYGVTFVPTFVYARGVNRIDAALSEGLSGGASVVDYYSVHGDTSLEYILEIFRKETKSASIDLLLSALERSVNGR